MRKLLFTTAALVASAAFSFANAADLPMAPVYKAPPPPVWTWTGCYLSAGVGYGLQNSSHFFETAPPGAVTITGSDHQGGEGVLGRFGGGCDYQLNALGLSNIVIGAFGDYNVNGLVGNFEGSLVPLRGEETQRGTWSVGGRVGYSPWQNLLTFVDGGFTQTSFSPVALFTPVGGIPTPFSLAGQTYNGWFVGGGTEYALNWVPIHGLFWRNEYRYESYAKADVPILLGGVPTGFAENTQKNIQTVTTSIVWRFNWGNF